MSVTVYKSDGTPLAGDPLMSDAMKAYAEEEKGYVTDDDTGDILYDARVQRPKKSES